MLSSAARCSCPRAREAPRMRSSSGSGAFGTRAPPVRRAPLHVTRAAAATGTAAVDTSAAVATVKAAATRPGSVAPAAVLDAMLQLEAAKLPADSWQQQLAAPGTHWRLIFTSDSKQVQAAQKKRKQGGGGGGGGIYFPLVAAQRFDAAAADFENGVFVLGGLLTLTFNGPFAMAGRRLTFDVVAMNLGVGPWRARIPIKGGGAATPIAQLPDAEAKKLPFFLYAYVDDRVVVGRGRSGGLALWVRADAEWEARTGVLRVYSKQ